MNLKRLSIPAAILAAATLATPAFAQRRGGEPEHRQSENRGQAERRGGGERAQPRAQAQRAPAPAPRVEQRAVPRQQATPRQVAPSVERRGGQYRGAVVAPRVEGRAVPRVDGRAVPRVAPRVLAPRYDNRYYYGGRSWSTPWRGYYGYSAFRPYYFRPWYRVGFGIYLGYPEPYYAYPYPVPVYGYGAPYGTVSVGPNNYDYGGVALEITPNDAAVYVDGSYAGIVADFDGSRQPLTLVPGTHHIEIDQNGFQPLAFDVTVQPGMVTPYQGSLQPY
jgi:hypothetical protein